MDIIRCIIIDDELALRQTNRMFIEENYSSIEIVGEAGSPEESVELINRLTPDLVLLDIELIGGNCFGIFKDLVYTSFKLIMVTAYKQYAIKAIKFNAIDYILKPVNETELCSAIDKAIEMIKSEEYKEHQPTQIQGFEQMYNNPSSNQKIMLRTSKAIHFIKANDIIYCNSDNSYTTFYILNKEPITVSKGLKEIEILFEGVNSVKPHRSYIVNINHITEVIKSDGGYIIVKGGDQIPISFRRKQDVLNIISGCNITY